MKRASLITLNLITFILLVSSPLFSSSSLEAKKGVLDLRDWNFEENGPAKLNGEWEFYWNKLINPNKLSKHNVVYTPYGAWENITVNDKNLPNEGFASFRLRVLTEKLNSPLGILIKNCLTACTLYVNGEKSSSLGRVGKSELKSEPGLGYIHHVSNKKTAQLDIVLHVSNFHYLDRNEDRTIVLGLNKDITKIHNYNYIIEALITGTLLIMGLYHIFVYLLGRKTKASLFFGIFALLFPFRAGIIGGSNIWVFVFPNLTWSVAKLIQFYAFFFAATSFAQFTYNLFPKENSKLLISVFWGSSVILGASLLFTKPINYPLIGTIFQVITVICMLRLIFGVMLAVHRRRGGSLLFLTALVVLFTSVLNDFMHIANVINTTRLSELGVMIFVLVQSILLSRVFGKTVKKLEKTEGDNRSLKKMDKQKTHFFQNISHEIRTPLTLILNSLENLTKSIPDNFNIEMAFKNSRRLFRLVNQLLDFQKITSKNNELKLGYIDIKELLKKTSEYFQPACKNKKIRFKLSIETESEIFILAQIDALEKILFNYLSNALKYTPENGFIVLELTEDKPVNMIKISVKDSGSGVSKEDQEKLFTAFSKIDECSVTNYDGTGLGLALAKELSQAMKGKVGLESEDGFGSTFWVEFPIAKREKKIIDLLIVDDETMSREHIEKHLISSSNITNYLMCGSPNEAREIISKYKVKCIFCDYNMPGESGPELLSHVARTSPKTKKVLFTGLTDLEQTDNQLNTSFIDHLLYKPFNADEVVPLLENLIEECKLLSTNPINLSKYIPKSWHLAEISASGKYEDTNDWKEYSPEKSNDRLILYVDDIPDMREMVVNIFNETNFKLITATNGQEAFDAAKKLNPDLIVTDWMMPKVNGIELIKMLRSDKVLSNTPVVLLTAKTDEDSRNYGTEMGANGYIGKPFNKLELLSLTENLLNLKDSEKKINSVNKYIKDNVLGRYLPDSVIEEVLDGKNILEKPPKLNYITILSAELTNFKDIFNNLGASRMSSHLNSIIVDLNQIISEHSGLLDSFDGSNFTVTFGIDKTQAPKDQIDNMFKCYREISKYFETNSDLNFEIKASAHYDLFLTGNFGGNKYSKFTAISPNKLILGSVISAAVSGELLFTKNVLDYLPDIEYEIHSKIKLPGSDKESTIYKALLKEKANKAA